MRISAFWRVLAAQGLSSFGTSMSAVALGFMVFKLTGSVAHMGGVMAVTTFPLIVTSWIGGAVLDRFSSKQVMVAADLARAALIFLMPFLAEAATSLIYVIAGLIGVCSAFFTPGQIKLVAELVDPDHLVKANSYVSVSQTGAELAGYLAAGVVVTVAGYAPAFFTDAGSYVLSAILLLGLPSPQPREGAPASVLALVRESPAVFMRLWRRPALRTNLLFGVFALLIFMTAVPNAYGLALEVFDQGAAGVAALEVAISCGLVVGGIIMSRLALKRDKNTYVFAAFLAVAVCFVGIYLSKFFWLSIALMGLAGVANVAMFVPSITMFQQASAEGDRGRMIALRSGFGQMGSTGGLLLGGVLGEALGIARTFLVGSLALVALSLIIYLPYRLRASARARAAWTAAAEQAILEEETR